MALDSKLKEDMERASGHQEVKPFQEEPTAGQMERLQEEPCAFQPERQQEEPLAPKPEQPQEKKSVSQPQDIQGQASFCERFDSLDAAMREITERQVKNDRQLAQYIKENVSFQIQVRQGMQEELEKLRREKKGDHFNPILSELAEIISVYRPLLSAEADSVVHQKNVQALFEQLEELMNDYDAEVFESEPGSVRRTRMSKIIKKIPTSDEAQHNTVVRSIRPGVAKGKLILSEEYIDVYVYDPELVVQAESTEETKACSGHAVTE